MPLSKSGSYHANPATAAMHDHAAAPIADPAGTATGGAHAVEIHHPNHPETGDGQNFHVRVHHADGNMEESKHASYDEAAQHGGEALGEHVGEAELSDDAGESEEDSEADGDGEY